MGGRFVSSAYDGKISAERCMSTMTRAGDSRLRNFMMKLSFAGNPGVYDLLVFGAIRVVFRFI